MRSNSLFSSVSGQYGTDQIERTIEMAFVTTSRIGAPSISDRFAAIAADLRTRHAQYKTYKTTYAELQNLSDRDLADLGIGRGKIAALALEAAYGI
jgi:uncharacterized protein YjiS (DUF1127 family)